MTDAEIIQKFTDIENRLRWLEMEYKSPELFRTDWSYQPTQGCSQEELMKASFHCTHEHP